MSYKYLLKTQTSHKLVPREAAATATNNSIMFCVLQALPHTVFSVFSGVHKLTAVYNILQHFLGFTNIIHIIMTANNV